MTEMEQLQQQIEELKKTVDDLKAGTIKVISTKQTVSQREMIIFHKYFVSQKESAQSNNENCKRAMNREYLLNYIRQLTREIFKVNNGHPELHILKIVKDSEQLENYIALFEKVCIFVNNSFTSDWLKKGDENETH